MIKQMEGQVNLSDVDGWCGRMFKELSVPEHQKEKTSESCLKKSQKSQMKMPIFLDLRKENGHQPDVSWQTDGVSLGGFMMHNTMVCLKDANEYVCVLTSEDNPHQEFYLNCGEKPLTPNPTKLSQILEINPDPKYNLSAKACQGILNRAEKRGKELPPILKEALIRQASPLRSGGGREVDSNGRKAGKGALIQEELSGTLGVSQDQTLISVYGICSDASNSMRSDNPHSGIYEADTSRTLDLNGGNPNCNQGGMVVVEGNGSRESHKGDGYRESETMYTLNTTEHHAVAYRKKGHPQNAQQGQGWEETEVNDTLNNNDNTDGHTPVVIVQEVKHKHHRRKKNG